MKDIKSAGKVFEITGKNRDELAEHLLQAMITPTDSGKPIPKATDGRKKKRTSGAGRKPKSASNAASASNRRSSDASAADSSESDSSTSSSSSSSESESESEEEKEKKKSKVGVVLRYIHILNLYYCVWIPLESLGPLTPVEEVSHEAEACEEGEGERERESEEGFSEEVQVEREGVQEGVDPEEG